VKRIGLFVAASILAAFAATLLSSRAMGQGAEAAVPRRVDRSTRADRHLHGANMAWYNWACDFG
jgi:hypothetical protein